MANTLEIVGSSTYTFNVQPQFDRSIAWTHNESVSPALPTEEIEIWTLRGAAYQSATPSSVTGDFSTLHALLGNGTTPVSSVKFKTAGSTTYEINTTTHHQLMVKSLEAPGGKGAWSSFWEGTIVIVGKKLLASAGTNIVRIEERITYSYDAQGLLTQTLEGRIETVPGTSALTSAQARAPASLGAAYVMETGGDNGLEIREENYAEDTIATYRQVQRESGESLPSTATSWLHASEVVEGEDGKVTTVSVTAGGTSSAGALTAARTVKPSGSLFRVVSERQNLDALTATATYVKREPRTTPRHSGAPRITSMRRVFSFSGGGQNRLFTDIQGHIPYETLAPRKVLTVRETITVYAVNVTALSMIPLPIPLWPENLQPNDSDETFPELDGGEADTRSADKYVRRASRLYAFRKDPPSADEVTSVIFASPSFSGDPDYVGRLD